MPAIQRKLTMSGSLVFSIACGSRVAMTPSIDDALASVTERPFSGVMMVAEGTRVVCAKAPRLPTRIWGASCWGRFCGWATRQDWWQGIPNSRTARWWSPRSPNAHNTSRLEAWSRRRPIARSLPWRTFPGMPRTSIESSLSTMTSVEGAADDATLERVLGMLDGFGLVVSR